MDVTHQHNKSIFSTPSKFVASPRKRVIDKSSHYSPASTYTETLLREYKILIESLAHLDTHAFTVISPEVNAIIDRLQQWFNQSSSNETLELYWTMRRLRRKIRSGAIN